MNILSRTKRAPMRRAIGACALLAAGAIAPQAALGDTPSAPTSDGGVIPYISDNAEGGGNVSCDALGYEFGSARANWGPGGFDVDFPPGITATVTDGIYVAWTSSFKIGAVIVKGGPAANVYEYAAPGANEDSGLASPPNASDGPAGLSNLTFCYNEQDEDPEIAIEKSVESQGEGEVEFRITVTNTGNVALSNVVVSDPLAPQCGTTIPSLPAGEEVSYTCLQELGTGETHVYKDTFSVRKYTNNNGDTNWKGPWREVDRKNAGGVAQDPLTGNVLVGTNGMLWLRNLPSQTPSPSVGRSANLSGADSAVLSFDWITWCGVDPEDRFVVEISKTGKAPFTRLQQFSGKSCERVTSEDFDITDHISANTRVRFRVLNGYKEEKEMFKVDNVVITAEKPPAGFTNEACVSGHYDGMTVSDCDTATVSFD
jgi:hypothetical protein